MKRAVLPLTLLLLLFMAAPLFAANRTVMIVDDVIRMSKAGVGDEEIIAFVRKTAEPFEVNGDDVIAMSDAHVSRAVIKAVIDESSARVRNDRRYADRRDDGGETVTRERTVYVAPAVYAPYYYDPYFYGFYDPFFYGPRLSVGFTFGRPFFGGFHRGFNHFHRRH